MDKTQSPAEPEKVGDIIQIANAEHGWWGCLLVVQEVRTWGVLAYANIPKSNDGSEAPAQAHNRLQRGSYEVVGAAILVIE